MFTNKEKNPKELKNTERNIVGKNTTIIGDVKSDGDFRIDGTLEGKLKTNGRVIIGVDGFVNGTIEAVNTDIEGKFLGQLQVSNTLKVKTTANISGDVTIGKLSIEPGATFNATCAMKGTLKGLNQKNGQKKITENPA